MKLVLRIDQLSSFHIIAMQGEEVTFDYNFVRVGGADAKKCECGASKCRGFIGVDPDTPQNVVDIDSDEGEDPEPIMLTAESDEEFDDKSKEGSVKRARMIAASDNRNEKLGGLKRKYYLGAAKDKEEPKRKRRVKTAASTKIASHAPAPSKFLVNSRFANRSTYHSDGEILLLFTFLITLRFLSLLMPSCCRRGMLLFFEECSIAGMYAL